MDIILNLHTVENKTLDILKDNPRARNDDRVLFAMYMEKHHNISTFEEYVKDYTAPTIESIRRIRQKVQAKGIYIPTENHIIKRRRKLQAEYSEYAIADKVSS